MVAAALVMGCVLGTLGTGVADDASEHGRLTGVRPSAVSSARLEPAPVAPGLEILMKPDKLLHMSISANLVLGSVALAEQFGVSRRWALVIGTATALAAGFLKEAWDMRGNGNPEWADVGANAIGTAAGLTVSLLFQLK